MDNSKLERKAFSDYDRFAWLYNKYWGSYFVDNLYHIIEDLALKHLPERASILDLCCGTGQLSNAIN
jgi:SAM-dependent methyltransferase